MAAQFNGRNGTEALLCEVITCYLEMAEEFARCWGALFACFTSFVCPIARLQLSIGKFKIVVTMSFF